MEWGGVGRRMWVGVGRGGGLKYRTQIGASECANACCIRGGAENKTSNFTSSNER